MEVKKTQQKPWVSLVVAIIALFLALIIAKVETINALELDFLDYRFKWRGKLDITESPIVILEIDDESDESTPERWPWPREYFAHVIDNLNEAGAKVIGVDVILSQADIHGAESDSSLISVLEQYDNVVLAGKLNRTQGKYETIYLVEPNEEFAQNASWGLVSSEVDGDGIFRRYLVSQSYRDTIYASFAAEVLRLYMDGSPQEYLKETENNFIVGDISVPKYDFYSMLINYAGPAYTFPYYSFVDVLDDSEFDIIFDYDLDAFDDPGDPELMIEPGLKYSGMLKDKIVLIGATMQELHDDFPTPFLETIDAEGQITKSLTPGVEVHANALNTILTQNFFHELGFWGHILIFLVLAFLIYLVTHYLHTLWGLIIAAIITISYFAGSIYVFRELNLIVEITTPALVILNSFIGHTLYRYLLEQKEKRMITGAFAHYVPAKVVAEILENPDSLQLGGEERVVSVMFSDVAGFTSISEKLTPAELVHLLNEYLTAMTDIVLENDGIIDKYEGDAIMAEFGMPIDDEKHAFKACKTALEMQTKLAELRLKWKAENKPQLTARVGINTGEVIVGNMGSRDVFDYTVMGDHVNLGSRLEGANKFYGTYIMISEFTYAYVKDDFHTRILDLIRVKGKEQPIQVYELIALKTEKLEANFEEMLDKYAKGIDAYRKRSWDEAIELFDQCLSAKPEDLPSQEYRRRCIEYKFNDPGEKWDGVTVMKEK